MFLRESFTNVGPKSWREMQERRQHKTEAGALGVGSTDLRVGWDSDTQLAV